MSRLELINYIKQNRSDGFSKSEIRSALFNAGWAKDDIELAFHNVGARRRRLFGLLAVLVITPLIGFGSAWLYSKYERSAPIASEPSTEQGAVAGVTTETSEEKQARDGQRISDIKTLQETLEKSFAAHQRYPKNLSELAAAGLLPDLPTDPKTEEPYLYNPLGEPPLYYSLSFILEEDAGNLKAGFNNVTN